MKSFFNDIFSRIQNCKSICLSTQESLCSSKVLECVKKVEVNDSNCLKPCSGLVVTSFTRSDPPSNLDILFPISGQYNKYKKITEHPVGYNGNH